MYSVIEQQCNELIREALIKVCPVQLRVLFSLLYSMCDLCDIFNVNEEENYQYDFITYRYKRFSEKFSVQRAPSSTIHFWCQRLGIDNMQYTKNLAPFDSFCYSSFNEFKFEHIGYFNFYIEER